MHNAPPFRRTPHQQREQSRRGIVRPLQFPTPEHQRFPTRQRPDLQHIESQPPHLLTRRVALPVSVPDRVPSHRDIAARCKPRLLRPQVARHEPVDRTPIPRLHLPFQNFPDPAHLTQPTMRSRWRATSRADHSQNQRNEQKRSLHADTGRIGSRRMPGSNSPCTSVSRRLIPLWRNVRRVWSSPSRCSTVACTS